jgi:hypothetical protein
MLKRLPVVSKDLLEDIPVPRGGCHHRIAPSGGDQIVTMERLYHASAASSTPYLASLRHPHPARLSLMNESFRDRKNAFSFFYVAGCCQAPWSIFSPSPCFGRWVSWSRSVWQLPVALEPIVSNDLLSVRVQTPVTRFSLRLSTGAGRLVGGDPIYTTAFFKARKLHGPPPPAPRSRGDSAPQYRLYFFEGCPFR